MCVTTNMTSSQHAEAYRTITNWKTKMCQKFYIKL